MDGVQGWLGVGDRWDSGMVRGGDRWDSGIVGVGYG